jgi:cytochrome c-type biogenesis protein CcmF
LVRSGVLTSVHAFASDPSRGVFILGFLAVVVGGSLVLFAVRAGKVQVGGSFSLVSRETFLLVNNVLLTTAAASVLLGTIYPLIVDALNMGKLSVGPPYFNAVFGPIMVPVLVFMVIGSYARWKNDSVSEIAKRLRPIAIVSVLAGCSLPLLAGTWSPLVALGLTLAVWIILASVVGIYRHAKKTRSSQSTPLSFWGMHVAHIGIAVTVIGVTMVKGYETEKDVRMSLGDTVMVAGYTFKLTEIGERNGPNYKADVGTVELLQGDKLLTTLHPEKRTYFSSTMPMTEAAIDSSLTRDVYVSLGEKLEDSATPAWAMRVYYKPFVTWIWFGCLIMSLGGTMAALDRRYRKKLTQRTSAVTTDTGAKPGSLRPDPALST